MLENIYSHIEIFLSDLIILKIIYHYNCWNLSTERYCKKCAGHWRETCIMYWINRLQLQYYNFTILSLHVIIKFRKLFKTFMKKTYRLKTSIGIAVFCLTQPSRVPPPCTTLCETVMYVSSHNVNIWKIKGNILFVNNCFCDVTKVSSFI